MTCPLPSRTPVLVIGGGPVGLVASALLSRQGVPHVLIERRRQNLLRLGEISRVLGEHASLASLERRLASLPSADREALAKAIEAQRSHFVSDGPLPPLSAPA